VSTNRTRELWRDRASGETFVVELEADRVLSAQGPVDPGRLSDVDAIATEAAAGRTPAFTERASDLEQRRDEFERRPLRDS
jgi:hypothetical protein